MSYMTTEIERTYVSGYIVRLLSEDGGSPYLLYPTSGQIESSNF